MRVLLFAEGDATVFSESLCRSIFVKRFHTQLLQITLGRIYFVQILVGSRGERDLTEIHKGLEALNPFAEGVHF